MADPITIALIAATGPVILAGIGSVQLALNALPEIHDVRTKHALKKLLALFWKARTGELTQKGGLVLQHCASPCFPFLTLPSI